MILRGSVVTQSVLGGLAVYLAASYFLWCKCAKNNESWSAVDKFIAVMKVCHLFDQCRVSSMLIDSDVGQTEMHLHIAHRDVSHSVLIEIVPMMFLL